MKTNMQIGRCSRNYTNGWTISNMKKLCTMIARNVALLIQGKHDSPAKSKSETNIIIINLLPEM